MHGEYKTPGGKMVVVDFAVAEGALFDMQVSGDFFLYPDDALAHISDSLEGLPTNASADTIADHVRRSLSPDTVLLGFSPLAIGCAVRNALGYGPVVEGETGDAKDGCLGQQQPGPTISAELTGTHAATT